VVPVNRRTAKIGPTKMLSVRIGGKASTRDNNSMLQLTTTTRYTRNWGNIYKKR